MTGVPVPLADWWPVARGRGTRMRLSGAEDVPAPYPAHVGLWLDRMLPDSFLHKQEKKDQEWTGRRQLYRAAVSALTPDASAESDPPAVQAYRPLFAAWRAALNAEDPAVERRSIPFVAKSRILLHPASNSSVTDGTVLLHHTYGVPYLPGSALKGALRSRLDKLAAGRGPEAQRIRALTGEILGRLGREDGETSGASPASEDEAGGLASLVDFYDALWIPEVPADAPPKWSPLALDIVNPHHPNYYTERGDGRGLPVDTEEPVPVQRLSLSPKTRFLVVVEASKSPELGPWLDWLLNEVLVAALADDGLGAWTTAGYGRLEPVDPHKRVSTTGDARAETTPAADLWQPARVFYEAGRGELRAVLSDKREARASQAQTRELLAALVADLRAALTEKKKREANAEVKIAPEGRSLRIVGLRPPGTES